MLTTTRASKKWIGLRIGHHVQAKYGAFWYTHETQCSQTNVRHSILLKPSATLRLDTTLKQESSSHYNTAHFLVNNLAVAEIRIVSCKPVSAAEGGPLDPSIIVILEHRSGRGSICQAFPQTLNVPLLLQEKATRSSMAFTNPFDTQYVLDKSSSKGTHKRYNDMCDKLPM